MKLRFLPTALGLLAALSAVAAARYQAIENAQEYLTGTLDEVVRAREAVSFERQPLWGEVKDGDAWPHYHRALGIIGCQDDLFARMKMRERDGFRWDDDELRALSAAKRPALDALREGAHRRNAEVGIRWEDHVAARIPKAVHVRTLVDVAIIELWNAAGTADEACAVDAMLDAHQFALDLANTPMSWVAAAGRSHLVSDSLAQALDDGLARRLSDASKARWSEVLTDMESTVSVERPGERIVNGGAIELVARAGLAPGVDLEWLPADSWRGVSAGWKHWFAPTHAAARATRKLVQSAAEARDFANVTGAKRAAWERKEFVQHFRAKNPYLHICRVDARARSEQMEVPLERIRSARERLARRASDATVLRQK